MQCLAVLHYTEAMVCLLVAPQLQLCLDQRQQYMEDHTI